MRAFMLVTVLVVVVVLSGCGVMYRSLFGGRNPGPLSPAPPMVNPSIQYFGSCAEVEQYLQPKTRKREASRD